MGKIYDSILELIGHTPLVELHKVEEAEGLSAHLYGKLEYFNPGGSIKDRIALNMIEAAEEEGKLGAGGTLIEGTSGNTGIGLALIAAAKGYQTKICMPKNMSKERIQILQGYGAEVFLTPAEENMAGAGKKAAELLGETENAVVIGQGGNPNNPNAHFKTTGPEIWEDLDGKVDVIVATVGTGGTLTGVGEYLRSKNPDVWLIAVEPAGSPVLSGGQPGPHKIQGIGGGAIAPVTKTELFNEVLTVTDEDAYEYARKIAKEEGISVGISSGAALEAALRIAKRPELKGKNIVVIFPDSGEKYLSSGLYDGEVDQVAKLRGVKPRPQEIKNEIDERGAFVRQPNYFRTPFGEGEGELKAESGRYRLFWAKGCHWSNRASIVRELLGLEDAISINIVAPTGQKNKYGWGFPKEPGQADPVTGIQFLSEVYQNADPSYTGRATVPALVDIQTKKVVNNDYHRLTNYLETAFKSWQAADAPDLYPEDLRKEIDDFNDWLFPNINNAHYRMAFCQSLEAYEEAFEEFYQAMDLLEERLSKNRFLFGDYVTDSDVRFFVTLARFDTHYYRNLGPIKKRVVDYENIWAYARDLYEIPAFKNNTYFKAFSRERGEGQLFASFNARFANVIDYEKIWSAPQERKWLSKTPEKKFR